MKDTKPWLRGARLGAAALLGLGLVMPAVTACSSSSGDETEQVEEESGDESSDESSDEDGDESGDLEETDPEPDIEE
jgi:hypothetical protein